MTIGSEAIAGMAIGGDAETSVIYDPVSRITGAGAGTNAPIALLGVPILWDDDSYILWDDDRIIFWDD
jgi:hypothetical protein